MEEENPFLLHWTYLVNYKNCRDQTDRLELRDILQILLRRFLFQLSLLKHSLPVLDLYWLYHCQDSIFLFLDSDVTLIDCWVGMEIQKIDYDQVRLLLE